MLRVVWLVTKISRTSDVNNQFHITVRFSGNSVRTGTIGQTAHSISEANITEAAGVWTVTLPDAAIEATKTTTITVETVNTTAAELTFTESARNSFPR